MVTHRLTDAQRELVAQYEPLARRAAFQFQSMTSSWIDLDELVDAAYSGLFAGARTFDPERGAAVGTWMRWKVRYALVDFLRWGAMWGGHRRRYDRNIGREPQRMVPMDREHFALEAAPGGDLEGVVAEDLAAEVRRRVQALGRDGYIALEVLGRGRKACDVAADLGLTASRVSQVLTLLRHPNHPKGARIRRALRGVIAPGRVPDGVARELLFKTWWPEARAPRSSARSRRSPRT